MHLTYKSSKSFKLVSINLFNSIIQLIMDRMEPPKTRQEKKGRGKMFGQHSGSDIYSAKHVRIQEYWFEAERRREAKAQRVNIVIASKAATEKSKRARKK